MGEAATPFLRYCLTFKLGVLLTMRDDESRFAIGTVERDTGIGRDTLRIWERRYGFPTPERNAKGERVYSAAQISRLQLIRRLMDQGMRPGKVVPLDKSALHELDKALPQVSSMPSEIEPTLARLIELASAGDAARLDAALEQALSRDGLRACVFLPLPPLTGPVGDLWAGGQLQVFEEHFVSRQLVRFLDVAMSRLGFPPEDPQVLLATLPGERHALGLLMVEALLRHGGSATLNMGTDVPMDQIVSAVQRTRVKTVALSFSGCYPRGPIRAHLEELVSRLPPGVDVWIGGAGVRRLPRLPSSVTRKTLDTL
jgi:MerR family transcriptional regulator, light-induced transcriptional regulator